MKHIIALLLLPVVHEQVRNVGCFWGWGGSSVTKCHASPHNARLLLAQIRLSVMTVIASVGVASSCHSCVWRPRLLVSSALLCRSAQDFTFAKVDGNASSCK